MACFNGKKYKQRNVGFKGDPDNNIPSSIDYITHIAKAFANLNQKNYVIYERRLITKGTFYDFEPQYLGRKPYTKLVRFARQSTSEGVLQDSGNGGHKSTKPAKGKGKSAKVKKPLGDS